MGIPLAAYPAESSDGKQLIEVWWDGQFQRVEPSIYPTLYSRDRIPINLSEDDMVEEVQLPGRWMGELDRSMVWRYRLRNDRVRKTVEMLNPGGPIGEKLDTMTACLVEDPDFFRQFPQRRDLTVAVFDLETLTKGNVFSTPSLDPIIAANLNGWDWLGDGKDDHEVVCKLVEMLSKYEVIANHNVRRFDLYFLSERARVNDIDTSVLSTDLSGLHTKGQNWQDLWLHGHVVFDTWLDGTRLDQRLAGVSRGLKAVADHWELPHIDLPSKGNMIDWVGKEELLDYVRSDVELATKFFEHYFPTKWEIAEILGTPLNMVLEGKASFPSHITQGRSMREARVFSTGTNQERYPFLNWGHHEKHSIYQAAVVRVIVQCRKCSHYFMFGKDFWTCPHCGMNTQVCGEDWLHQGGIYEEVHKLDFMSYYDWLQILFNLSGETTRLVRLDPYPQGEDYPLPRCKVEGKIRTTRVPDNVIKKTWVIETDLSFESPTVTKLRDLLWRRQEIKREMESVSDGSKKKMLDSKQFAMKTVGKTFSGANAQKYMPYGAIPVTVVIVGVARDGLMFMSNWIKKNYGIEIEIEEDTDGIFVSKEVDIERLNQELNDYLVEKYGIEPEFIVEMEDFGAGIFFGRKTYMLLDKGKLKVVGTALKSTRRPSFWKELVSIWGKSVLEDGITRLNMPFDIRGMGLGEYVMMVTLNKHPWEYGGKGLRLEVDLAQQASNYRVPMQRGETHSYIETRRFQYQFETATVKSTHRVMQSVEGKDEVRIKHYEGMVEKLRTKFNKVLHRPTTLDSFLG